MPSFISCPEPVIAPARVSVLPLVSKVPPDPSSVNGRVLVKLAVAWILPPARVSAPAVPKAASEPACTVPPVIAVPPV